MKKKLTAYLPSGRDGMSKHQQAQPSSYLTPGFNKGSILILLGASLSHLAGHCSRQNAETDGQLI